MGCLNKLNVDSKYNRVTFKYLGEIAELERGTSITKKSIVEGSIPVVAGGRKPAYFHNKSNRMGETIVIVGSGAYAGFVSYWNQPIFVSDAFSIKPNWEIAQPKYIFYFLKNYQNKLFNLQQKGGGTPHIYIKNVSPILIPTPPLEVQQEIVRILDQFTELEAELEARRKQYEYYRDYLLKFKAAHEGVKIRKLKLGDLGKVSMCKRVFKHETKSVGDVPFFKIGTFGSVPNAFITKELYDEYKTKYPFPKKGDVLISAAGTIGRAIPYDGEDAYFQDSNIVWIDNNESVVINKYLWYWYQIVNWTTDGGTIKRLYNNNLRRTKIDVPPIKIQREIVSILDKFNFLVNDLTIGLPAEIKARRQQYEYYRDKLLTFKEIS